ncbi:MAG TPA: MBL fold metallo-hydrolase [Acidimicrobiia bacterium]|nr:MBL fold metallo-hydrolase [Acidimicrobiia bacterium]
MSYSVVVLGTAQDGGLPQFGARSSLSHRARHEAVLARMAASIAIVDDTGRTVLVDPSPDLRHQEAFLHRFGPYAARPGTAPPVDAIVVTHGHMGHYLGLAHFGREAAATSAIPCYVTHPTAGFLVSNAPWRLLVEDQHVALRPYSAPEAVEVWDGLEIELLPVPHRHEYTDTVAVSIAGTVLYLPDIDRWDDWAAAEETIARHEIALLDATFWSADEVPGRDVADIPHPLVPDTIERFGHLAAGRRLMLTHLNHTNPVADPSSDAARQVAEAGFEVAVDGMVLEV